MDVNGTIDRLSAQLYDWPQQILETDSELRSGISHSRPDGPPTKAERLAKGDPRLSVEERYNNHGQYVAQVARAADRLVRQRLLLDEDAVTIITQAAESDVGN